MIELTRRLEPRDIINALAGVSIPVHQIIASGKLQPSELYRIEPVMQGLLALRQVIDVKDGQGSVRDYQDREQIERLRADLLAVATDVLERSRCLTRCGYAQQQDVGGIIDSYCDAIDVAAHVLGLIDRALESHFRVALRWTTP